MISLRRRKLLVGALAVVAMGIVPASRVLAEGKHHQLVIHVTESDPKKHKMVLNIAKMLTKQYRSKGDTVEIEIVAHGPGLDMLRLDKSPVRKLIGVLDIEQGNLQFSACGNTMSIAAKKEGKEVTLIPEAKIVPFGVYRIIELQDAGWNYIRP